jgi:hypothetical protein
MFYQSVSLYVTKRRCVRGQMTNKTMVKWQIHVRRPRVWNNGFNESKGPTRWKNDFTNRKGSAFEYIGSKVPPRWKIIFTNRKGPAFEIMALTNRKVPRVERMTSWSRKAPRLVFQSFKYLSVGRHPWNVYRQNHWTAWCDSRNVDIHLYRRFAQRACKKIFRRNHITVVPKLSCPGYQSK